MGRPEGGVPGGKTEECHGEEARGPKTGPDAPPATGEEAGVAHADESDDKDQTDRRHQHGQRKDLGTQEELHGQQQREEDTDSCRPHSGADEKGVETGNDERRDEQPRHHQVGRGRLVQDEG